MPDDELDKLQKKMFAWVLAAVIGGNAGTVFNAITPKVRNDPWTGTQGMVHEQRLDRIESFVELSRWRMVQCEEFHKECQARLIEIDKRLDGK